jgi:hypothetical protein
MEFRADAGQLIYSVKERNRYFLALKEINRIVSTIDNVHGAESELNLISRLCREALASKRKINSEVNKAVSLLTPR